MKMESLKYSSVDEARILDLFLCSFTILGDLLSIINSSAISSASLNNAENRVTEFARSDM